MAILTVWKFFEMYRLWVLLNLMCGVFLLAWFLKIIKFIKEMTPLYSEMFWVQESELLQLSWICPDVSLIGHLFVRKCTGSK